VTASAVPGTSADAVAHAALTGGAVVADRSARGRTTFAGPRAAEVLNGLVTSDVISLAPGQGQYSAALTPKGKVVADLRIFRRAEDILVDASPPAAPGWWALVKKYVNPRLAAYADVTDATSTVGACGPAATHLVAAVCGLDEGTLGALGAYGHVAAPALDDAFVARVPDFGVDGYDIVLPRGTVAALVASLAAQGAVPATEAAHRCPRGSRPPRVGHGHERGHPRSGSQPR
jgi:glycine cleavage system aminomethyltransferase T